jgi:prepilin-type N-terminal cleavage/methylation domain-containing protein
MAEDHVYRRVAFTLIEVLVVVAIIPLLVLCWWRRR